MKENTEKAGYVRKKIAYLTFDDGPRPVTRRILKILALHQASATFFMLEPNIRRYPFIVRRMVREGHAVGLHGVTHNAKIFYASKAAVLNELEQTRETLRKTAGKTTVLIRTPYGSKPLLKPKFARAIRKAGYQLWDWNVDSLDWKYRNQSCVKRVMKAVRSLEKDNVRPVILMHDLKETTSFLPQLIKLLKRRGYVLKKLDPSLKPVQFVK